MDTQSDVKAVMPGRHFAGVWSALVWALVGGVFLNVILAGDHRLAVGILTVIVTLILLQIGFKAVIYGIVTVTVVLVDGPLPTRSVDDVPLRFGIGRVYLLEIAILLLLFAYLVRRRNSGKENSSEGVFVSTPLGLPLGALLVALPVFALYGLLLGHPLQYAVGYYEWRCIFIAILFYFLVTSIFQEYRDLRKLWRWFFLIASAKALYSLVLVITNISPPLPLVFGQGPVDEGPEIIMYLFAALQAGAILAFHAEKNREWRAILLAGALIMVADVALSQKRTPQLGFLIGLAVLGWYLPRREKTRWVLGAALLALLIASSGVLASRGSTDSGIAASFSRYNEVMEFVHAPGVSTSGGGTFPFHVFDLIDGWEKIKEAPLLGQGFGGQSERNLSLALLHEGRDFTTGFIHNQYLTFWLKMGVTGPILMVWLLGGFLLHCSRKMKRISKTFASATVIGIYAAICADIAMEFWGASWIGNTKTPIVVFLSMALAIGFLRCCSDGARFPSPSRIAVTPHSGVGGHFREH